MSLKQIKVLFLIEGINIIKEMKICILTENYYRGGLDTFIINLINNWPDKNDEFVIICNKSHPGLYDIKKKIKNKIELIEYNFFFTNEISNGFSKNIILRSFPARAFFRILNNIFEFPLLYIYYFYFFKKKFQKYKFELFFSVNGGYPASLVCRIGLLSWYSLYGSKSSYLFFHSHAMKMRKVLKFVDIYMDRLIYKSVNLIITVSKSCINSIEERHSIFSKGKVIYIYNGVEDFYNQYTINKYSNNFIMLSTYTSIKGYDFLIKIVRKLKFFNSNFKIIIYGYGKQHEYKKIKNNIFKYGLENFIELNPFTSDPHSVLKNSKALICLSQSQEAFGLTLVEAMSLGVPVVTTNVGGLKEVFKNSNAGYIFEKDDVNGFVEALLSLLENKALIEKFSTQARKHYIKNFTSIKMAKKYHDVIKKI